MFIGSEPSEIGHTIMEGIASVSEVETNKVYWRVGMVANLIVNIDPNPCRKSTFLTKREC
jgi:hypothetical protein